VERRHQEYPQLRAFLKLLLSLARAHAAASLPLPAGFSTCLLSERPASLCSVFAVHAGFGYATEGERWDVASCCLSLFLQLLEAYDPSSDPSHELCGAPPPTTPAEATAWLLSTRAAPAEQGHWEWVSGAGGGGGAPLPYGAAHAARRPIGAGGGAVGGGGGEIKYTLPELPAALRLLCEFYKPRSPLLHQLQLLLARASAALSPGGGASHHDRDEGSASLEVYRAAMLSARLLDTLLELERPARDKLRRVQAAHKLAESWRVWDDEQRSAILLLHGELWRSLPASASPQLPLSLTEQHPLAAPADAGAHPPAPAPPRRSALASAVLLLAAASADAPRPYGLPLAVASARILRCARSALGGRFAPLLRAEGVLGRARTALELLVDPATEAALGVRLCGEEEGEGLDDPWEGELAEHLPPPPPPPHRSLAASGSSLRPVHEPAGAAASPACTLLLLMLDDMGDMGHGNGGRPAVAAPPASPTALALLGLVCEGGHPAPSTGEAAPT